MKNLKKIWVIFIILSTINNVLGQKINELTKEEILTKNKKKVNTIIEELFAKIETNNTKVEFWIFEFIHSDSLNLTKVKTLSAFIGLETEEVQFSRDGFTDYPNVFFIETYDKKSYTEDSIKKRIKVLNKAFNKDNIILGGIGYAVQSNPNKISLDKTYNINTTKPEDNQKVQNKGTLRLTGIIKAEDAGILPYATIGIPNKHFGVISNVDGKFQINIPSEYLNQIISISHIGYKTKNLSISDIDPLKKLEINLIPETLRLDEVVVSVTSKRKRKKVTLGKKNASNTFGFVQGGKVGAEISRLMDVKKKERINLTSVGVYISNLEKKSFTLLVNLYHLDETTKLPGKQLLKKQVVVNSELENGWLNVSLDDKNLIIDKPFFVAFQWINDEVSNPSIGLSGSNNSTFTKYKVMGNWKNSKDFPWVIKAEGYLLK
ncbi:carboxypeptidase-like regulatory domain-containing protein [uncultured Croceitalea sp.]|uniref:carboxypeptidase-like regulatory domain-containing protein n=1 Tax=uncultured Croceitalea sp. TaxID=1798908 RepID=UPI003305D34F